MMQIQKMTTQYDAHEDRISLIAAIEGDQSIRFWLTRRFIDRLVPHLTAWLQKHAVGAFAEDVLEFQQSHAGQNLKTETPVINTSDRSVLIDTIDLKSDNDTIELVFNLEGEQYRILFSRYALQQWLSIILQTYQVAEWSIDSWPRWFKDSAKPAVHTSRSLIH